MKNGALLIAVVFLSESLRLAWLARFPAAPDFLLGIVVLVALSRRPPAGAAVGLALGFFRDVLYGGFFGVEGLSLTLVGWGVGSLGKAIYREAAVTQAVVILGAGLLRGALVYLLRTEADFAGLPGYVSVSAAPSAATTAILVPLIYHFIPRGKPRPLSAHEKRKLLQQR